MSNPRDFDLPITSPVRDTPNFIRKTNIGENAAEFISSVTCRTHRLRRDSEQMSCVAAMSVFDVSSYRCCLLASQLQLTGISAMPSQFCVQLSVVSVVSTEMSFPDCNCEDDLVTKNRAACSIRSSLGQNKMCQVFTANNIDRRWSSHSALQL